MWLQVNGVVRILEKRVWQGPRWEAQKVLMPEESFDCKSLDLKKARRSSADCSAHSGRQPEAGEIL